MGGDKDKDVGDETRNQIMQNLFGEQSEDDDDEDDEERVQSENQSDEGEGGGEGENDDRVEGQGEVEMESEGEAPNIDRQQEESEGERVPSSPEKEVSNQQQLESEGKDAESDDDFGQRAATSRRRDVIASESEGSEDNRDANHDNEDEEVDQEGKLSRSPAEEKDEAAVRKVFGDSDDEEAEFGAQDELEQDAHRSPMDEDGDAYEKDLRPEDVVPDEDAQYESENEHHLQKPNDKPVGPPLDLEIPLALPPGRPDKMNMIKVSNIMGMEPKPFDPKTYVEEDVFVTDESGTKKRIRLEDNIVRWRKVKRRDGTSIESNARFVKWSDGSMQLLIGNEVLDLTVQEAQHDQAHLFLRHGKGILQSQGRLLQKMRFMPSSLTSKSHRLLTALVDSRHKKVYKVKNCITDIDPEREKVEKEKVEGQTIRANELLHRKREKVNRKYTPAFRRERQLSPGFLEDDPEEDDEPDDYYSSRRPSARDHFEEDLVAEAQAEKRITNAKKSNVNRSVPRRTSLPSGRTSKRPVDSESEREESEYESDGENIERSPVQGWDDDGLPEHEDEYEDDEEDEEAAGTNSMSEEEEEEPRHKTKESGGSSIKRKKFESDEESPPRKAATHRRKAIVFDSDED